MSLMIKMTLITIYVNIEFWQMSYWSQVRQEAAMILSSPTPRSSSLYQVSQSPDELSFENKLWILYKGCVQTKTLFRSSLKQKRREKKVSSGRRRRSPVTKMMMMMKYKRSWVRKKRQVRKRRILTNQRRRISKRKSHKRSKNKRKGVYSSCQKKHSIFLFCVINVAIWSNEVFSTKWTARNLLYKLSRKIEWT